MKAEKYGDTIEVRYPIREGIRARHTYQPDKFGRLVLVEVRVIGEDIRATDLRAVTLSEPQEIVSALKRG